MSFGSLHVLVLGVTFILLLDAAGAFCLSGTQFQWGINSLGQNPCEIAGDLLSVCLGKGTRISPLKAGSTYPTSQTNGDGNRCFCSSVYYAIISACAQCQRRNWPDWDDQTRNCNGVTFVQKINITIPSDTQLPSWAFLDYRAQGSFNLTAARADALHPTSSPIPTLTSSMASVSTTSASSALANATSSLTSTSLVNPSSGSSALKDGERGRTNVGAIVGGVIGGVVLLFLLILTLCCLRRRRRNNPMRIDSPIEESRPGDRTEDPEKTTLGNNPVNNVNTTTPGTAPLANPADTSTNMSPNSADQKTLPSNTFQEQTHSCLVDNNPSNNSRNLAEGQNRPGTTVVDRNAEDPGTHGSKKLCCK
ncbi:hypothetical protein BJ165DRAFT_197632 [Panaeolus papilionaceus]|nr:hypothetical protein BJ165DRAFT_197632 [Panaeolus papilionaceus]